MASTSLMSTNPSETKITFFDIKGNLANQERQSGSPWCWRVRLVLNYKKLPYTTRWAPVSEITSISEEMGFEPTGTKVDGSPHYTLPAIVDETDPTKPTVCLSDSQRIITYLEQTYPDESRPLFPSPFPASGHPYTPAPALYFLLKQFEAVHIFPHIGPLIFDEMVARLPPADVERARQRTIANTGKDFKMQSGSPGPEGSPEKEAVWKKLEDGFGVLAELLENGEKMRAGMGIEGTLTAEGGSPSTTSFFMGGQITYADLFICGMLVKLRTSSPEIAWGRIKGWHGGRWERLWNSLEEYIVVK